jgi:hypothetical protein
MTRRFRAAQERGNLALVGWLPAQASIPPPPPTEVWVLARKAPATTCPVHRRLGGDGAPALQLCSPRVHHRAMPRSGPITPTLERSAFPIHAPTPRKGARAAAAWRPLPSAGFHPPRGARQPKRGRSAALRDHAGGQRAPQACATGLLEPNAHSCAAFREAPKEARAERTTDLSRSRCLVVRADQIFLRGDLPAFGRIFEV